MNILKLEKEIENTIIELENELEHISRFNYSDYQCYVLRKKINILSDCLNKLKE